MLLNCQRQQNHKTCFSDIRTIKDGGQYPVSRDIGYRDFG